VGKYAALQSAIAAKGAKFDNQVVPDWIKSPAAMR
jgi:hypothetical protein